MDFIRSAFTHWRTSAAGILGGALIAYSHGQSWHSIAAGVAVAILGLVAKDAAKQ